MKNVVLILECCDNLYCFRKTRTCQPKLALGEACKNNECAGPNFCRTGVCTAPFESGRICTKNYQCKSGNCRSLGGERKKTCE